MVVDAQHADRRRLCRHLTALRQPQRRAAAGDRNATALRTTTSTSVPAPDALHSRRRPPMRSARSRMPDRP